MRQLLLTYAKEWLGEGPEAEGMWEVFAEIVHYCFTPVVEGTWTDPAAYRTLTIANGVESPGHLHDLIDLWDQAHTTLRTVVPGRVPAGAIRHLVELLEDWLRLAGGHARGTASVTPEQRDAGSVGAWTILRTLRPLPKTFNPGWRFGRRKRSISLSDGDVNPPGVAPLLLDDDLVLFSGRREPWDSAEAWIEQRDRDQLELSERLMRLGPMAGTDRFVRLANASATSGRAEGGGLVALRLAQLAGQPRRVDSSRCQPWFHRLRFTRPSARLGSETFP